MPNQFTSPQAFFCSIDGCGNRSIARSLCHAHYKRWRLHGDPSLGGAPTDAQRFWAKVNKDGPRWLVGGTRCWLWTGAKKAGGYGLFATTVDGKQKMNKAHRYAYQLVVGPIPAGYDLDHLCLTSSCVNPLHLEPVTRGENTRRAQPVRTTGGQYQTFARRNQHV